MPTSFPARFTPATFRTSLAELCPGSARSVGQNGDREISTPTIVVFKTPSDWRFCHPPLNMHHLGRGQPEGMEFDI
jgi:hypothetical protein